MTFVRNSDELEEIYATLAEENQKSKGFESTATPQLAQRSGDIFAKFPALKPGVNLSLAKAGFTDEQIEKLYPVASTAALEESVKEPKKKSWLERNAYDKLKTGSRYGFAALNYPLDFVQGGIAQVFDTNDGGSVAGWNIQSDLGSLIANDTEAGSGFFIGGKAKELQAERARRYRGTIGGHAWTLGRGLASTVFEPDTKPFNFMSGMFDAALAVYIPTVPAAKGVGKAINILDEAGNTSKTVQAGVKVMETVGRGSVAIKASQITAKEIDDAKQAILVGRSVDFEAANRWFGSGQADRVVERASTTNEFIDVWDLFGRKIDPKLAADIAAETNPDKIRLLLIDQLGQSSGLVKSTDFKGGNRVYASLKFRDKAINNLPLGQYASRAYAKMAKRNVNLFDAETTQDQISHLNTLDAMLKLGLVDRDVQRTLMNQAGKIVTNKNPIQHAQFVKNLDTAMRDAAVNAGVDKNVVKAIFDGGDGFRDAATRYNFNDVGGEIDDGGLFNRLTGQSGNTVFADAQLTSEFGKYEYYIPDVRQLRRLTGTKINWIYAKSDKNLKALSDAGELRLPFAAVRHVQEELWRPVITATIGNFTRNIVDSQIMIALSHKPVSSIIRHPLEYLLLLRKELGWSDIYARNIDGPALANAESAAQVAHKKGVTELVGAQYAADNMGAYRKAQRLNTFSIRTRGIDPTGDVVMGHADEIGKLNADWAARSLANGLTRDDLVALIRSGDKDATEWYQSMKKMYDIGRRLYDTNTRQFVGKHAVDLRDDQNLLQVLIETEQRLSRITGNNPKLVKAVGQAKLDSVMIDASKVLTKNPEIGERVVYKTSGATRDARRAQGEVVGINRATGEYEISPYAFIEGESTSSLSKLLNDVFDDPDMPMRVGGEVRTVAKTTGATKRAFDSLMNSFHGKLYGEPIGALERSPVFKQLYHQQIDRLAVSLDDQSVNQIISDITARAAADGTKPELFMNEKIWQKLLDIQSGKIKNYGTITSEELNAFASGQALDDLMKMFYNAVERKNFTDSMRLISPFGQQWAEFLGRVGRTAATPAFGGKIYLPDINVLRKGQITIEGVTEADPDGDGRGYVYKDPTTGKMTFTFPLSGQLTKMFTGVTSTLSAPIRGAFMGFDYRPGLGPFATIAVGEIIGDSPQFNTFRSVLLPYGERTGLRAVTPSWMTKLYDGFTGNEGSKIFMDTTVETMEALAGSGKYDLTDNNQRDKLIEEAKSKAGFLTILRGVQQFLGPAAASYDQKVKIGELDVYVSQMARAFQELKEADYDSSVSNFLEIFGEDAFVYMAQKSESLVGGLESSKEFGVFEQKNRGLFRQYGDVAGYFGPIGSDFDLTVYQRQFDTGQRRKLTPKEVLESAEETIGMAYYRTMRANFPTSLNEEQRVYIKQYRTALEKRYPGYRNKDIIVNKSKNQIEDIAKASLLPSLDDNETALGVRYYMTLRDSAISEANNRGISLASQGAEDLRGWLANYAPAITQKYPGFAKVYDRVLSQEVEE